MTTPRPRAYFISSENYERAIDDPALGALAAEGWTVAAATIVQRGRVNAGGEEVVELMLLLWPPARPLTTITAAPLELERRRGWDLDPAIVAIGVGALLALVIAILAASGVL